MLPNAAQLPPAPVAKRRAACRLRPLPHAARDATRARLSNIAQPTACARGFATVRALPYAFLLARAKERAAYAPMVGRMARL